MKEIPLTQGKVALVDDADYEAVAAFVWHAIKARNTWYASRQIPHPEGGFRPDPRYKLGHPKQIAVSMHAFLTGNSRTDHIDGDGLNNRRINLRPATRSENGANVKLRSDNTSGWKGIVLDKRDGSWRCRISVQGVRVHGGCFRSKKAAAARYNQLALDYHGQFARLNDLVNGGTL